MLVNLFFQIILSILKLTIAMRILIVEDDERISGSLAEALTDQRYIVDVATDGQKQVLRETLTYELILLMLPKLDGISLCWQPRSMVIAYPDSVDCSRDTADQVRG